METADEVKAKTWSPGYFSVFISHPPRLSSPKSARSSRSYFPTPNIGPLSCQDYQIYGLNTHRLKLFSALLRVLISLEDTDKSNFKNKAKHNSEETTLPPFLKPSLWGTVAHTRNQGYSGLCSEFQDTLSYNEDLPPLNLFSWLSNAFREEKSRHPQSDLALPFHPVLQATFVPDRHDCLLVISKPLCLCAVCQMLSSLPSTLPHLLQASSNGTLSYWHSPLCPTNPFPL